MIPIDMNLKIRSGTVGYNNKILVSDEMVILGNNENVNSLTLSYRVKGPVRNSSEDDKMNCEKHVVNLLLF